MFIKYIIFIIVPLFISSSFNDFAHVYYESIQERLVSIRIITERYKVAVKREELLKGMLEIIEDSPEILVDQLDRVREDKQALEDVLYILKK